MEILCETEKRLKEAGVNLEDLHVEPAPGQFEINYQPAWGILGQFFFWTVRVRQDSFIPGTKSVRLIAKFT